MATVGGQGSPGSVSRTARYRKVTKPLLERRRRARINRCLDELKDLMVGALEVERENISKLEKADILELTVRHLSKQRTTRDPRAEAERFQAGFGHCASEAYHFILSSPGVDSTITRQLVRHLSSQMNDGPIGFPALASPVPSDSSLSPSTSSKDYSPNYYPERSRTRSVVSAEEFDRSHPGWKGDSSSVPVEQSLTCDVDPYNPRPVSARSSEGMPGLLMTVNSECAPRQLPSNNVNSHIERHRPPEVRYDIRNGQHSESKNLIMQKIREHILERQHRETESPDHQQKQARRSGNINHSIGDDSIQLALSKNVSDLSVYSRESNAHMVKRVLSPGTSEEAINLSSAPVEKNGEAESKKRDFPKYVEGYFKPTKQQADYKSIHPKKAMIRTPKNIPSRGENEASQVRRNLDKPSINQLNQPNGCRERDNTGSEGDDSAASFDDRDISAAEAYYLRYKYREYNRQQQQYQDQVDDENMWRPW